MKKTLCAIIAVLSLLSLHSQDVELAKAKDFAVKYMIKHKLNSSEKNSVTKSIKNKKNDTTCFYTFAFDGGGYINIAATEYSHPALSVSINGNIAEYSDCPAYNMWMDNYKTQILEIKRKSKKINHKLKKSQKWDMNEEQTLESIKNNETFAIKAATVTLPIGPLIETRWGQSIANDGSCDGFNFKVNSSTSECSNCISQKCPAGCVAVAMAQVARYWNFPYKTYPNFRFRADNFDFCNMPMELRQSSANYTIERNAISELISSCGILAGMNYCKGDECTSSTTPSKAKRAMQTLGYTCDLDWNAYHSNWAWKEKLRDNLEAGRPIIYSGGHLAINDTYGHTFICDGYGLNDDPDLFHFNWGWRDKAINDWFTIGALNPEDDEYNLLNSALFVSPSYSITCSGVYDIKYEMVRYMIEWFNDYGVMVKAPRDMILSPPEAGQIITPESSTDLYYSTIYAGESAEFKAFNSITIQAGFEVEIGAELEISIIRCPSECIY